MEAQPTALDRFVENEHDDAPKSFFSLKRKGFKRGLEEWPWLCEKKNALWY